MHNFCINEFEGPLDLLLHLIKETKMNIYDINMAEIISQYLEYIHHQEQQNIDVASEYLVMASELVHLKSKMLINQTDEDDSNEGFSVNSEEELKTKLIAYQKYRDVTENFKELESKRGEVFTKYPERQDTFWDEELRTENIMDVTDLINAFNLFQERQKYAQPLQTTIAKKEIAVVGRIKEIRKLINDKGKVNFFHLFDRVDKEYLIITFLAILEMSKNNEIILQQKDNFGNIMIEKRG